MPDTNNVVRWGIVGLGGVVAEVVAPAMVAMGGGRLIACAGRTLGKSQAFAAQFGVERVYPDHTALMADPDVDAVYIATPNALHHPVVMAAARANKHVLCEKPFALTVDEGEQMVTACRDAGVILRVAHQIRLEPALQHVRAVIQAGTVGELRSVTFERTAPMRERGAWRSELRQGGILFDVAVHLLDLIRWITLCEYREVVAVSHPDRRDGKPDDTIAVLGRLGDACNFVVRASREVPFAKNDLIIEGTKGMLATSALRWADEFVVRVTTTDGVDEKRFTPQPAYRLEIEAFEGEVAGVPSLLPHGEDGVNMIRLTDAILQSINTRQVVAL